MDFSISETQQDLTGLAKQVFDKELTLELRKAAEQEQSFLTGVWKSVSDAGLAGITIDEAHGGLGLSFLDAAMVLVEVGRSVAEVPLLHASVAGVAFAASGRAEAHSPLLSAIADGTAIVPVAASEFGNLSTVPVASATGDADGWTINGAWVPVPYAAQATALLIGARADDGVVVALIDPRAPQVQLTQELALNWQPQASVTVTGLRVDPSSVLASGAEGAALWERIRQHLLVGMCAMASGVAHESLRQTAEYATNRKQFDRPIGSFQAVAQRLADAFVDARGIELTMLQAATHLSEGKSVPNEAATAKFWASEAGSRVGHASLHVHGGVSIDIDFPIHRYFLWAKQLEFSLGAATAQLLEIGKSLARTAPGLGEWRT